MRTFLLSVFWITNFGSFVQLLVISTASWIVLSGSSSITELSVDEFITQFIPWMLWVKSIIVAFFGEFGRWILTIPILVIAPLKLVTGTGIGIWAYIVAKNMPMKTVYA